MYGKYIFRINYKILDISNIHDIWITNPDSNEDIGS